MLSKVSGGGDGCFAGVVEVIVTVTVPLRTGERKVVLLLVVPSTAGVVGHSDRGCSAVGGDHIGYQLHEGVG